MNVCVDVRGRSVSVLHQSCQVRTVGEASVSFFLQQLANGQTTLKKKVKRERRTLQAVKKHSPH
jgi:hypothetical protein